MKNFVINFVVLTLAMALNCQNQIAGELIKNKSKPENGFNYDYLIFLPEDISKAKEHYMLVEPNNSGFPDDNIETHEKHARHLAGVNSIGNYVSTKLKIPLVVPIFPRPMSDQNTYTHALDRDAILLKNNNYERLDLQLLAIIDDAKKELNKRGYKVKDKIFLNGFSASGSFVNRFSLIHPDIIAALAIGGFNGILMLPITELENEKLNYPLGVNDFQEIARAKFNLSDFKKIRQFIYLGDKDNNDAVRYDDAYSKEERRIIYKVLGEKMQPDRWHKCQKLYKSNGLVNVQFKTFEGIGHGTPYSVLDEIVQYFKESETEL